MRQLNSRPKRFRDKLPGHIGAGFLRELSELVDELASEGPAGQYLKKEYLSKYSDSSTTSPDMRRTAAIEKWLATEARNARTNQRLQNADADMPLSGLTWGYLRDKIRKVVRDILGPLPYPLILWDGSFSGGASTRVNRSPRAMVDKLTGRAHCSSTAMQHWISATVGTVLEDLECVARESSGLFTVPKSTHIDRVACKEPEINMYLQRSVGFYIRSRLRRVGVDLNDQTRNQNLAKVAYHRNLATVDLSSASDSVTRQLVFELLPFEWWSLLDDLRVKETLITEGGVKTTHELEMFSSMGNGFTFELESLLFYAITRVVCWVSGTKGTVSVYGDDIICPSAVVPRLSAILGFLGFILNPKKTNFKGPWRESCGKHYHRGVDVTPFYVRAPIASVSDLIKTLNQLLIWDATGYGFITDDRILAFHYKWSQHVPQELWGGQNPEDISSLVTGHPPRMRILHEHTTLKCDEVARYKTWFTLRRLTDLPLDVTPSKQLKPIIGIQPWWTVRTTWTPWLLKSS